VGGEPSYKLDHPTISENLLLLLAPVLKRDPDMSGRAIWIAVQHFISDHQNFVFCPLVPRTGFSGARF
jgi:hypothetical protein